ncbi:MAG: AAA family ATPase [Bacilli bacterium]|nr:AAA family ATPase [Bacilli bacterium]
MNLTEHEITQEKNYLNYSLKIVRDKISELGQVLYDREEKVMEFKKFIWDTRHDMDPTEMKTMINASDLEITMMSYKSDYLQKLYRIQNNPYFGSITFKDSTGENKIYIGITHVEDEENDKYLIHDWRAPICSMFYDYELGKAEYLAPEGIIKGEITNKRQFTIKDGKLVRVFDNNINIDDELLQQVLTEESNDKMKNIVNTIQQEQNAIIRNTVDPNLIVQGIAGSGKTSVALHRIAFLLYKIKNLNSNNVLIFSPNQIFTEYISNVLPELGESNTLQTTFNSFLETVLDEFNKVESFTEFVERYYKYQERNPMLVKYKQSDEIIDALEKYIKNMLNKLKFENDLITRDFEISADELNYLLKDRYEKILLIERLDKIADKICNDYYKGKHGNKLKILSMLNKSLNIKINYKEIFKDFFRSEEFLNTYKGTITEKEIKDSVGTREIKYEDACIFVYIKGLLEGFTYRGQIQEIVIDEAQDYNRLQYKLIRTIFKKSNFTILGDINQTVNPYYRYNSLEDLSEIFEGSIYLELSKTYRSSPEIIEHTNKILGLKHVSAIRRDNHRPVIFRDDWNLKDSLISDIKDAKKCNYTVAVITKTDEEAQKVYDLLKDDIKDVNLLLSTTKEFNKKMVVIPSYMAKGLEFDETIIYTDSNNKYTKEEKYLYYVACTRAQHQLIIYNQEEK